MTEVQVMGDAQPTETGIGGLLLLPDGRIQLGDRVYLANEEVFGSLPGDWAVHKAEGASQPVKCKRGDGTEKAFVYHGSQWNQTSTAEIVNLTAVKDESRSIQQSERAPERDIIRDYAEAKQCFWGVHPTFRRPDIEFLASGRIRLGDKVFGLWDSIDSHTWGSTVASRRRTGKRFILTIDEPGSQLLLLYDYWQGWFQLSKCSESQIKTLYVFFAALSKTIYALLLLGIAFILTRWFYPIKPFDYIDREIVFVAIVLIVPTIALYSRIFRQMHLHQSKVCLETQQDLSAEAYSLSWMSRKVYPLNRYL